MQDFFWEKTCQRLPLSLRNFLMILKRKMIVYYCIGLLLGVYRLISESFLCNFYQVITVGGLT